MIHLFCINMIFILDERSIGSFPIEFFIDDLDGSIDVLNIIFIDPIIKVLHFKSR